MAVVACPSSPKKANELCSLSSELRPVFDMASKTGSYLCMDEAFKAFTSCDVRMTYSQLLEATKRAESFAGRAPDSSEATPGQTDLKPTEPYLLFGEFCWCVALYRHRMNGVQQDDGHFGKEIRLDSQLDTLHHSLSQSHAKLTAQQQVFLGGSCNPTTWRKSIVIPELEANGITYYNPQVDDWYPELIETERIAKEKAAVLLFVVDSETRAIASMVEAAYLSGLGRLVLLVVRCVEVGVAGSQASKDSILVHPDEVDDLNNARALLLDIAEKSGKFVFSEVSSATSCVVELFTESPPSSFDKASSSEEDIAGAAASERTSTSDGIVAGQTLPDTTEPHAVSSDSQPSSAEGSTASEDSNSLQRRSRRAPPLFMARSGTYSSADGDGTSPSSLRRHNVGMTVSSLRFGKSIELLQKAFKTAATPADGDVDSLPNSLDTILKDMFSRMSISISDCQGIPQSRSDPLTYDTFCQITAEHLQLVTNNGGSSPTLLSPRSPSKKNPFAYMQEMVGMGLCTLARKWRWLLGGELAAIPAVFLGGTCGTSSWRQDIAEPLLRQHNVSFFNPQMAAGWTMCRIPEEAYNRDNCSVLLVCITAESRSAGALVEAAYSIGRKRRLVISIENLPAGFSVGGEKMSERAIKDYNRGRAYLTELCHRHGVPLFSDVKMAVECCVALASSAVPTPV